ncbi:C4-dicarboxylate transporter, substrate-binding protein [Desulfamplus magnetovallimortis]|uniref:C4-dicarboxylate transporter, substrate-binding protein n=1 Tax=Desulfamplus magnetovallimortis TaxID=1246637 RepID=A0A1W1H8L8_9BACT|nr:TRAP transporter substrate-binding protein DctP [Desulfamplus magnetovallimortis]SLM28735.1 C4-dicarboxylate transporter, substrate-binding protein [Desulfamplus magnetovallimortis]
MKRREFIKKAGAGAIAAGAAMGAAVPAIAAKPVIWKMVTTWPPHFPMLGEGADYIAQLVNEMSGGKFKINVYGAGELVPGLGVFDAVSQGTVEMGHGAAYYWAGKAPAAQFFAAVPFGFNAQSQNAWVASGGGMALWEEIYKPFNLKPYLGGNTGVQMGGWFNKEINSIEDLKGLKMRIPGLGGKVLAKAGGNAILVAGGEIYTNLDRGVIDATEWVGPYHDLKMGFYKVAKYYYYPGWHEPGTTLEAMVNLNAYEALSPEFKAILDTAIERTNSWMLAEFEAKNNDALNELITKHNVQLKKFPDDVLKQLKTYADEVLEEVAAGDPMSRKVLDSFKAFRAKIYEWNKITEEPYHQFKYI